MFALIFFLGFSSVALAQGDLLIFPKRLVFKGTQTRVQNLHLNNSGKDTATYRLSFLEVRMHSDGQFENILSPDRGQRFASPHLRFYPRTITLAPNETQVVRVQLTKTNGLMNGEYRSHLYFRAVPNTKGHKKKEGNNEREGVNIDLIPIYGISIANIIQIGKSEVEVNISNLDFEMLNHNYPIISMNFNRQGNHSSYGDIRIQHISTEGKETEVALIKGFAVYAPAIFRTARIELKDVGELHFGSGKLKVTYSPQGGEKTYAEAMLSLKVP
jgi:hypothetical protein